jgi:hypothetical protein
MNGPETKFAIDPSCDKPDTCRAFQHCTSAEAIRIAILDAQSSGNTARLFSLLSSLECQNADTIGLRQQGDDFFSPKIHDL